MYKGKRVKKITKMSRRAALLVLSLVTILSISVGGTLAYLIQQTGGVTNVFQPGTVTTTTDESFDGNQKSDVKVVAGADHNVDAYVRAKVVVTWVDGEGENGSFTYASVPVEGVDYTIEYNNSKWAEGSDGFWYYGEALSKDVKETKPLITSCSPIEGRGPEEARLQVTILSQTVQANVVEAAWEKGMMWPDKDLTTLTPTGDTN